jgi:predicted O-methyltransferase YrrM
MLAKKAHESNERETLSAELAALGEPSIERLLGGPWKLHLPFAYHLIREIKPKVFVELGVYKGESYFVFCQSAQENHLPTECYGIDTWLGDLHAGLYCDEIGSEVASYNKRYSGFSHLMRMTFQEAVREFPDGSIDLLHIDGAHRYEDVKADFEMWRPKLSKGGVVLMM